MHLYATVRGSSGAVHRCRGYYAWSLGVLDIRAGNTFATFVSLWRTPFTFPLLISLRALSIIRDCAGIQGTPSRGGRKYILEGLLTVLVTQYPPYI